MKEQIKIVDEIMSSGAFAIMVASPLDPDSTVVVDHRNCMRIKGYISHLTVGNVYTVELKESNHPKYGFQYEVKEAPSFDTSNMTPEDNLQMLQQITTNTQANNIQKEYPNFVSLVLSGKEDSIDYKKIYNVGKSRFTFYCKEITEKYGFLIAQEEFKDYGFSIRDCEKLFKAYKSIEVIRERIKENPYEVLVDKLEQSFRTADKTILKLRPKLKSSNIRCEFWIFYILKVNENTGSTCINANTMVQYAINPNPQNEFYAPELRDLFVDTVNNSDLIYFDQETKNIGLKSTYDKEMQIASCIEMLTNNPNDTNLNWQDYQTLDGFNLTDEQLGLLQIASEKSVGMLVGGAGTGKTSAVQALIKMLDDHQLTYMLLAPTGVASKRLSQATKRPASTIHRALSQPDIEIITDYVIVDELSICGVEHLYMIFKAIHHDTKVIFIGDNAQLASIATGNIMENFITFNKIPTAKLTKVFRYGKGGIDTVATDIRNSKQFIDGNGELCFEQNADDNQFKFIPCGGVGASYSEEIIKAYDSLLKEYKHSEILVLTPTNKNDYGTRNINNILQEKYNPVQNKPFMECEHKGENFTIKFTEGDRVIHIKNVYDALSLQKLQFEENDEIDSYDEINIYNGDMGVIQDVDETYITAQFDENIALFTKKDAYNLLLGSAITVHRIQGGASKAVILVTPPHHMITNNLMYVGLTRASEKAIWIGDVDTIRKGIHKHENADRKTWMGIRWEKETEPC